MVDDDTCVFTVWAPFAQEVTVNLLRPHGGNVTLLRDSRGYHSATIAGVPAGTRYFYSLDGGTGLPDPASRYQPEGVHGPSEVCSRDFAWTDDAWRGIPQRDYVLYELHVGTFTAEGTFDAIIPRLQQLRDLGITAIELMPVSQFPGERNWGYDGSYPYAVQNSYGGPKALKRLINACHKAGICAVLDVVYNHFGPEGNYTGQYGPYFTDKYHTPWGKAMNFDGPGSDEVRWYFIQNALYWLVEFHFDALRLDALHAILDTSAKPFLAELVDSVQEERARTGRHLHLIGESDLNDPRLLRRREQGGIALDAQWDDDFHHALHALLTGERTGYYADFGNIGHLAEAFKHGFVYSGQYSTYRQRSHGDSSRDIPTERFVVFSQNHDQVGNRFRGDRLSTMVSFESLKLAAACVILSPYLPLLFMGEEYAETAPFPYFVSHSDPDLIQAVRTGRAAEFKSFLWEGDPPDPQSRDTFLSAKLGWQKQSDVRQTVLWHFYRELIFLRSTIAGLKTPTRNHEWIQAFGEKFVLFVAHSHNEGNAALVLNFLEHDSAINVPLKVGRWHTRLDSADSRWLGGGSRLPETMESTGSMEIVLGPRSAILLLERLEP